MSFLSTEVSAVKKICAVFQGQDLLSLKTFSRRLSQESHLLFHVKCQLGTHAQGTDRFDQAEEVHLLLRAVALAYPYLPEELQKIAPDVSYVVNHEAVLTKQYIGFSAEDDPEYNYYYGQKEFEKDTRNTGKKFMGDTQFYPSGTIKINVTEKFIQSLKLSEVLMDQTDDPVILRGLQASIVALIAHELKHAHQYHTNPVRDMGRFPHLVADGLAPLDLLEETRIKIEYELDASDLDKTYLDKESLLAYADAFEAYEKSHPSEFEPSGRFSLLSSKRPKPYREYYLIEAAKVVDEKHKFSKGARITYYSQTIPPQLVHDLIRLKEDIKKNLSVGNVSRPKKFSFFGKLGNITKQWNEFMSGANREFLFSKDEYRVFLEGIEGRFNRERDEVKRLLTQLQ